MKGVCEIGQEGQGMEGGRCEIGQEGQGMEGGGVR